MQNTHNNLAYELLVLRCNNKKISIIAGVWYRQLNERATMTPFTILILVCSMALDHAACQPETALDKIQVPVANELQCGLKAQAVLAANGAALAPRPGLEYVKIVCRHTASLDNRKTAELE